MIRSPLFLSPPLAQREHLAFSLKLRATIPTKLPNTHTHTLVEQKPMCVYVCVCVCAEAMTAELRDTHANIDL